MQLKELLAAAGVPAIECRGEAEISAVADDSRRCAPGTCFLAVRGANEDGHKFIPAAIAAGAAAVVCQDPSAVGPSVACAVVSDCRRVAGPIAQAMIGWPSRKLTSLAVTGTKGKTTTTFLVRHILEASGRKTGLIGTISNETGLRSMPSANTSPGPVDLANLMGEMLTAGCGHMVMEVSSHALDQHRTGGVEFRVGVFTNLSGDHMDYHGTMDNYFAAKRRLFEQLPPDGTAVINRDDARGASLADVGSAAKLSYGLGEGCDLRGRILKMDFGGTEFEMSLRGQTVLVRSPLMGRHNVYNCLAAAGVCAALGIDLAVAAAALEKAPQVPGRLQRVGVDAPYGVFVDYAHTDDSLANVLSSLSRKGLSGRIIVVFGCGGDRDRTKRPRMARVAEQLADHVVITSDNPRTEDPQQILDEIVAGLSPEGRRRADIQIDRRSAIELAISKAGPGDIVLIAGKGHEDYQIIGKTKVHFDDREVAAETMRRRSTQP